MHGHVTHAAVWHISYYSIAELRAAVIAQLIAAQAASGVYSNKAQDSFRSISQQAPPTRKLFSETHMPAVVLQLLS